MSRFTDAQFQRIKGPNFRVPYGAECQLSSQNSPWLPSTVQLPYRLSESIFLTARSWEHLPIYLSPRPLCELRFAKYFRTDPGPSHGGRHTAPLVALRVTWHPLPAHAGKSCRCRQHIGKEMQASRLGGQRC